MLVGDETIEQWPEALWPPLTIFKMGSAGDRTQHTLWRLRQVAEHLNTRFGVVMLGGGNLADGDDPAEVAAGIHAVVRKTEFVARAPTAAMLLPRLVGVPPELDRRRAKLNDLLRSEPSIPSIDVELAYRPLDTDPRDVGIRREPALPAYQTYRAMTRSILAHLDDVLPRLARASE